MGNCCSGGVKMPDISMDDLNPFESKGDTTSRCNVMLKECTEYLSKLKKADKDLKALSTAAEGTLDGTKVVLEAHLPRTYEYSSAGAAAASRPADTIGGMAFSAETVAKAKSDLIQRTQGDSFGPMAAWISSYNDAAKKQKAVNGRWDSQESLKKKVEALKAKVEQLRSGAGDAKGAQKLESASKELQMKEGELDIAINRHSEEEAQQYAKLVALVNEATQLRNYIKNALAHVSQALGEASASIEAAPVPGAVPTAVAHVATPAPVPADTIPSSPAASPMAPTPQPMVPQPMAPQPIVPAPQPSEMAVGLVPVPAGEAAGPSAPPLPAAPPASRAGYPTVQP